jgi:hypothetical protein
MITSFEVGSIFKIIDQASPPRWRGTKLLGPGIVGRVVAKLQRQHLAPRSFHSVSGRWSADRWARAATAILNCP